MATRVYTIEEITERVADRIDAVKSEYYEAIAEYRVEWMSAIYSSTIFNWTGRLRWFFRTGKVVLPPTESMTTEDISRFFTIYAGMGERMELSFIEGRYDDALIRLNRLERMCYFDSEVDDTIRLNDKEISLLMVN